MKYLIKLIILSILVIQISCETIVESKYETIKIENQVWMSENLNIDKFNNGDPIPEAKSSEEWRLAGENEQPAWCYFDNDPVNGKKYGKLYNWYAVNDPRGIAPSGFHIPNNDEWEVLMNNLGGQSMAGIKMKSTAGWEENGNGNNESGFNAFPSGSRSGNGRFANFGLRGYWWSSNDYNEIFSWVHKVVYNEDYLDRYTNPKTSGFSVRCLKD